MNRYQKYTLTLKYCLVVQCRILLSFSTLILEFGFSVIVFSNSEFPTKLVWISFVFVVHIVMPRIYLIDDICKVFRYIFCYMIIYILLYGIYIRYFNITPNEITSLLNIIIIIITTEGYSWSVYAVSMCNASLKQTSASVCIFCKGSCSDIS